MLLGAKTVLLLSLSIIFIIYLYLYEKDLKMTESIALLHRKYLAYLLIFGISFVLAEPRGRNKDFFYYWLKIWAYFISCTYVCTMSISILITIQKQKRADGREEFGENIPGEARGNFSRLHIIHHLKFNKNLSSFF